MIVRPGPGAAKSMVCPSLVRSESLGIRIPGRWSAAPSSSGAGRLSGNVEKSIIADGSFTNVRPSTLVQLPQEKVLAGGGWRRSRGRVRRCRRHRPPERPGTRRAVLVSGAQAPHEPPSLPGLYRCRTVPDFDHNSHAVLAVAAIAV